MANSIAITIFNNALSATQNKNYEEAAKYYLEAIKYDSEIFKEYNTKIYDYANSLPHNMSYLLLKNVIKKSSPYYQLIFDWIMNNGISHKCKDWRIISNYALGNIYGINNDFVNADKYWKQAISESDNIKEDIHSMAYSARLNAIANITHNEKDILNASKQILNNNQNINYYLIKKN